MFRADITRLQVLATVVIFVTVVLILTIVWPKYADWRETAAMRQEVRWAETWTAVYHTLPEGTDLNQYILMRKIEDTDIEEIKR